MMKACTCHWLTILGPRLWCGGVWVSAVPPRRVGRVWVIRRPTVVHADLAVAVLTSKCERCGGGKKSLGTQGVLIRISGLLSSAFGPSVVAE